MGKAPVILAGSATFSFLAGTWIAMVMPEGTMGDCFSFLAGTRIAMVMPEGIVGDCFSILASTKVALVMPEKSDNLCVCGGGRRGGVGAWWSQGNL